MFSIIRVAVVTVSLHSKETLTKTLLLVATGVHLTGQNGYATSDHLVECSSLSFQGPTTEHLSYRSHFRTFKFSLAHKL